MNFTKNSKGITLIALVITIIVLLILAAVSLNLVAGGDGILGKATTAVDTTNKAKIAEEVELALAELKTEYYEAKYVDRTTNGTFAQYVSAKFSEEGSIATANGTIKLSGTTITYENKAGVAEGTGTFDAATGSVTISGITTGGNTPATFASQIEPKNYGEYVDLGTNLIVKDNIALEDGKVPTTDWRIFHKDDNGVYLILADYLPYSYESTLGTGLLNSGTDYPYSWISTTNRKDLIDRLKGTASEFAGVNPWNNLIESKYTAKGITVKGSLDLETWLKSWNAKNTMQLYAQYTTDTEKYNAEGYLVGIENPPTTYAKSVSSDTTGYGNTLYFPHKSSLSRNSAYWLASPSANYDTGVIRVSCDGNVNYYHYNNGYGIRPAIHIPSDITAEKVDGVWQLDI